MKEVEIQDEPLRIFPGEVVTGPDDGLEILYVFTSDGDLEDPEQASLIITRMVAEDLLAILNAYFLEGAEEDYYCPVCKQERDSIISLEDLAEHERFAGVRTICWDCILGFIEEGIKKGP